VDGLDRGIDAMEWLFIALAAGGSAGYVTKRWRVRRVLRATQQAELEGVQRLVDEDVTLLGEQLQRLQTESREMDEETRLDYQTALDAYESGKRAVPRIGSADEISTITDTLSTGRYALACVRARPAGRPIPEFRPPCFFNPQHGPSVENVVWTSSRHGTRSVPACAQDAARVANRERPEVRTVRIGSREVPYWEAGAAYLPYSRGYFASAGFAPGAAAALPWADVAPTEIGGGHAYGGGAGHSGGFHGGHEHGGAEGPSGGSGGTHGGDPGGGGMF